MLFPILSPITVSTSSPGVLMVVAGQSNVENSQTIGETVPVPEQFSDSNIRIWNTTTQAFETYDATGNSNEYNSGALDPQEWGPEAKFAVDFRAQYPTTRLDIVKVAVGSTALRDGSGDDWAPTSTGELFEDLEDNVAAAQASILSEYGETTPVSFFLFGQGEEDAEDLTDITNYYNNLLAFETAMRSRIGDSSTIFAVMRIIPSTVKAYATTVRAAQGRFIRDATGPAKLIDIDFFDWLPDDLHLSVTGNTELGEAAFEVYEDTYTEPPVRFSPISTDKSYALNLSSNNLVVEGTGTFVSGNQSIRCDTLIHYSAKSYIEIECTQLTGNVTIGMGATPGTSSYWGSIADSVGYAPSGNAYEGGSVQSVLSSYTTGDIIMMAHDGATGKTWFGKNGTWNGDPAAGTGEFATLTIKSSTTMWRYGVSARRSGDILTIQTTPNYTVPTGFTHFT